MRIALLLAGVLLQEEVRSEWQGFAEGSSVTRRVTMFDGEKQESAVERYTIAKVEAEAVTVKGEVGGRSKEVRVNLKKETGYRKTGAEDLDIDGKTISCSVYEKSAEEGGVRRTVRQWLSRDVPGRIAKTEIVESTALGEQRTVGRITRLGQRLEIGGKVVTYAIYELSGRTEGGLQGTVTRWVSEQVPGFVVREEMRRRRDGGKEALLVTELVDFEVK